MKLDTITNKQTSAKNKQKRFNIPQVKQPTNKLYCL